MKFLRPIFGILDKEKVIYTSLYSLFYISLTSATLSVLDVHNFKAFGINFTFTVGLIFFPLTFVISNFIQDRYNIQIANTVVLVALASDGILMLMLHIMSSLGDSQASYTVYNPLFKVWCISAFSITISCFFNNIIFKYIRRHFSKGFFGALISILTSSTMAEIILTCISLPLILTMSSEVSNVVSAIIFNLVYKLTFTSVASFIIALIKAYIEYTNEKIDLYRKQIGQSSI